MYSHTAVTSGSHEGWVSGEYIACRGDFPGLPLHYNFTTTESSHLPGTCISESFASSLAIWLVVPQHVKGSLLSASASMFDVPFHFSSFAISLAVMKHALEILIYWSYLVVQTGTSSTWFVRHICCVTIPVSEAFDSANSNIKLICNSFISLNPPSTNSKALTCMHILYTRIHNDLTQHNTDSCKHRKFCSFSFHPHVIQSLTVQIWETVSYHKRYLISAIELWIKCHLF